MKTLCLSLCILFGLPAAAGPPADWSTWRAAIEHGFSHAGRVRTNLIKSDHTCACPQDEKLRKEYKALFFPGGLTANVKPEDAKIFAGISLCIRRLKPGAKPMAFLRKVARKQASPPHCFVSKSAHLQLEWAGYWIELTAGCSAGRMVYYEMGDLLEWLRGLDAGSALPERAIFSRCGQMQLRVVKTKWLFEQAGKKREFWGREFPAARRRAAGKQTVLESPRYEVLP